MRWAALKPVATLFLAACAWTAQAAMPQVTPLPGQPTLSLGPFDPATLGYIVEEYVVSGTATSYKEAGPPDEAGRWNVRSDATAPYVTRIVVIRPARPERFNGSVVVEWMNVSGGLDVPVVWNMTRRQLVRSGSALVAVSAQRVGIEGGPSLSNAGQPLKKVNPQRYGRLSHPGDAFSYDIFSQVGALVRGRGPGSVLGNLVAKKVIAVGESQSAGYLTTYVNAVDPTAKVYDGILIHSRFGSSALLNPPPPPAPPQAGAGGAAGPPTPPRIVKIRSELRVPVLIVVAETDVVGFGPPGYSQARQPDSNRLRAWEIAGAAHADAYFVKVGEVDSGTATPAQLAAAFAPTDDMRGAKLAKPYNNGPQHHYIMQAAIAHLQRWAAGGAPPPPGTRLTVTGTGAADDPVRVVPDNHGNAQGGVRSPWMDIPTSRLSGIGNSGTPSARLYGVAEPFDAPTLQRLYPGGKADYLRKFEAALDRAIKAGFILAADRPEILALAAASYAGPS